MSTLSLHELNNAISHAVQRTFEIECRLLRITRPCLVKRCQEDLKYYKELLDNLYKHRFIRTLQSELNVYPYIYERSDHFRFFEFQCLMLRRREERQILFEFDQLAIDD